MTTLITIAMVALLAQAPSAPQGTSPAQPQSPLPQTSEGDDALQLQVMLDRAGFSPGAIDGKMGANTRKAFELFNATGMQPASVPATITYRITAADVAGPFIAQAPKDMMESAKLPALGYTSAIEELAERFHTTAAFLQQLNPGISFTADQEIHVPNVEPMVLPATMSVLEPKQPKPTGQRGVTSNASQPTGTSGTHEAVEKPNLVIAVSRSASALTVTDASGRVVLYAPVTTGSTHDPLPIGEWKVTSIFFNPAFNYNPDLFWDADPSHTKATLKPGPNNPVGVVWINLSKEHYGLHGTPEPATIGRTQSHGCVRLTNWDALRLASLAKPGAPVVFKE